jgi:hypothetical protein
MQGAKSILGAGNSCAAPRSDVRLFDRRESDPVFVRTLADNNDTDKIRIIPRAFPHSNMASDIEERTRILDRHRVESRRHRFSHGTRPFSGDGIRQNGIGERT